MFVNIISKILDVLVHPFFFILALIVWAILTKRSGLKRGLYIVAAILFVVFTNVPLFNNVEKAWCGAQQEPWPTKHYTYCFLPGGFTESFDTVYQTAGYRQAVDRMHTAALFVKEGICDTIVVSGDGASGYNGGDPEGFARHAERLFGIPAGCIKVEQYALTTMQNFQYSIPLMQCGNTITVNSARYMARTRLCARLQGFRTNFFSVQYTFNQGDFYYEFVDYVPRWKTVEKWYELMHEWAGYLWYNVVYGWNAKEVEEYEEPRVCLQTTKGNIIVKLYNETPLHRDNFLKIAETGVLDSTLFHRVIEDFMIQGGDPDSKHAEPGQMLGEGEIWESVPAEFDYPKLYHKRGVLAAAREGDDVNPERKSSSSQFYIAWGKVFDNDSILDARVARFKPYGVADVDPAVREVYHTLGGIPHLDGIYTVFGEVVTGLDIVYQIQKVATDENDRPLEDVRVLRFYKL